MSGASLPVRADVSAAKRAVPAQQRPYDAERFEVLAHHDLGGDGFNADVDSHRGFAYVGSEKLSLGGFFTVCPASGVKAVDISHPTRPVRASVLQNPPATSSEDVVAKHVDNPYFRGDLLVTGIQPCNRFDDVFRGLQFFDVTDPYHPRELGRWESPKPTEGCHEVDLSVRHDGRVLAGCATIFAEDDLPGTDAVTFVDASNPRVPVRAGGFSLRRDLGGANERAVGCFPASIAHNPRFVNDGRHVYVSYWDAGTMLLDIADPGQPRFLGTTVTTPPDEDGDNHSMALAEDGDILLINSEDFSPLDRSLGRCAPGEWNGWGDLYIYDNRDRFNPRLLSSFSTPNSNTNRGDPLTSGIFTVHNTEVVDDDQVFASWYSDGIRWIDLSSPSRPVERGHFVPPPAPDPHFVLPAVPFVWGVVPDDEQKLILASDVNSGLWILKPKGVRFERPEPQCRAKAKGKQSAPPCGRGRPH